MSTDNRKTIAVSPETYQALKESKRAKFGESWDQYLARLAKI